MADPKQEESFKVVDKRLFTEQGELRREIVEQEKQEEAAAQRAASAAQASAKSQKQSNGSPAAAKNESQEISKEASPLVGETHEPSRSFQMLVDFLTRNAAAMLGGMADPQTGQAFLDLEGAREIIDMIDTLREKTRGNLAKVDEDMIMEVSGSVKLTFMEIAKAAAEQRAKQAGSKK